jgi:hypothetical protein
MPKFPTQDPNHRILQAQWSRFMHYYFYLWLKVLEVDRRKQSRIRRHEKRKVSPEEFHGVRRNKTSSATDSPPQSLKHFSPIP